ncbi:MAG: hypothetical protein EBT79_07550 [Actinobacteria bacterium]|nr:hypothetical protein [Actinomycetota bacterium]NBR67114.1 hypothetical protein [Actinomycetota bacterium]
MYDTTLPNHAIEPAIHRFARQRARNIMRAAPPAVVDAMGGEERIVRMCLRDAARASVALTVPPRVRLERMVAHWSQVLTLADAGHPPPDEEDLISLELDGILRTRVAELEAALASGDVDGAFRMLRNMTVARDGEEQPAAVAVPDTLDPDSAYWLDLAQDT